MRLFLRATTRFRRTGFIVKLGCLARTSDSDERRRRVSVYVGLGDVPGVKVIDRDEVHGT